MLDRLRALATPIRVAMVGVGSMGRGLLHQARITPGIECVAVADLDIERAVAAAVANGRQYRIVESPGALEDAVAAGFLGIAADGDLVARCETSDVFVEASSSILAGCEFAVSAIESGKHLVLMNAEVDLAFGPVLLDLARRRGVTYTSCDGDQHGVIKHLLDEVTLWGFDPVMAGNIKGFLDRQATPTSIVAEADKRNLDYRMATAYTDGTKLNIEMALVANACGYSTLRTGMTGPSASDVHDVFSLFDFDAIRAGATPVVDYVVGATPGGGVFVVAHCDDAYQRSMLQYYKMGDGPFYLFYRPYHLCHIEAMECIAAAFLDRRSLLAPLHGYRTNVIAYAKRDLQEGEALDGVGGYTCYGLMENISPELSEGLPICLATEVEVRRSIAAGERISMVDIRYDAGRRDFALHRMGSKLAEVR